eukprot:Amastigsp_a510479_16.p4 type:complete len:110 gc:universal Amastigsp_a510479_16:446-775(+)
MKNLRTCARRRTLGSSRIVYATQHATRLKRWMNARRLAHRYAYFCFVHAWSSSSMGSIAEYASWSMRVSWRATSASSTSQIVSRWGRRLGILGLGTRSSDCTMRGRMSV